MRPEWLNGEGCLLSLFETDAPTLAAPTKCCASPQEHPYMFVTY
jgi:hypothetical protein